MSRLEVLVTEPQSASAPWNAERALSVVVTNLVAFAAIALGAVVSDRSDDPQDALVWLNVSIAGLVLAGVANGAWLMRARRTLARGRALCLTLATERFAVASEAITEHVGHGEVVLVWAPGTARYHRADCSFARNRAVDSIAPDEAAFPALKACEVCRP